MILYFVFSFLNPVLLNLWLIFFLGLLILHVYHEPFIILSLNQMFLLLFIAVNLIKFVPNILK